MDNEEWLNYDEDDAICDTSFPESFSHIFSEQISQNMREHFNEIGNTWLRMGIPVTKRDAKIDELRSAIMDQVTRFQAAEEQSLKEQQNYREYQLNEINKILAALSLEAYNLDTSKALMAQNKRLNLKYRELQNVKTERMDLLERIEVKLKKVCHSLGVDYIRPTFATNIPSEPELMTMRSHLASQEQVFESRKKRFESSKALVTKYQKDLEYVPQDDNEKMLLLAPPSELIFSQQNLMLMADLHKKIIEKFNEAKEEIDRLKARLSKLFERLDIEESVRQAFWNSIIAGSLPRRRDLLVAEIDRYEELKKSCMEKIVKSIRKDIDQLRKACMVSIFNESILDSEDYSEELLLEHENAFAELAKFNEHYSGVFEKLYEWEEALEQLLQLEKKLLDPNRFNNRGGALLQNERDRKMLNKKLPRLEKEVKSLVTMIESKEQIPFSKYGLYIDDYFELNWSHFKEKKGDAKFPATNGKIGLGGGCNSSKKSSTLSSQKKPRMALSPRVNALNIRRPANPSASRRLFAPTIEKTTKSNSAIPAEEEFFRNINNDLHSTFMDDQLFPPVFNRNLKLTRRLSKSMDNVNDFNGMVTKRTKRPPFLP